MSERLNALCTNFGKWKMHTLLIHALWAGAVAWAQGHDVPVVESLLLPKTKLGDLTASACREQATLGWHVWLRGFWVSKWHIAQECAFSL